MNHSCMCFVMTQTQSQILVSRPSNSSRSNPAGRRHTLRGRAGCGYSRSKLDSKELRIKSFQD